ncbi:IS3 family transposase [Variovorax saccharolyticus]|uniref:IS3 family transposase n=1 Tax=Variovorax saccharolyticus TaxID=3053516 RepID=UPI004037878C
MGLHDGVDMAYSRPRRQVVDATYVKTREAGRIVSVAVIVAVGVNTDGQREVLGLKVGASEAEPFFGRLKKELFYPRQWRSRTIEQFVQALDSYIRWYNEKRINISLGSRSPLEYRASLGLAA